MNAARSTMRLVRDGDPPAGAAPDPPLALPLPAAQRAPRPPAPVVPSVPVIDQLSGMRDEIDALNAEINSLRRRDQTLRFYMHRLDEELRLAARLQQDFLPRVLPRVGPVHFHTLFRPAGYVSGDLYDVMRLDEHHVGFFICDAVGHGMPAALLTMFIKRALVTKEIFPGGGYRLLEPSETLARLNQALIDQNLSQATYATALYGLIDTRTLEVRFARGGHPSPAVLSSQNAPGPAAARFIDASGALLGIFDDETFEVCRVTLQPGERLFVYSDGIEVGFCGADIGDTSRWQDELARRLHLPTDALLEELSNELDRQSGSLQPKDDLTILVMETSPHR